MSKETIAIFTNFTEFNPGYSLTGIVRDQCLMLSRFGHKVSVFVNENFNTRYPGPDGIFELRAEVPKGNLVDYRSRNALKPEHHQFVTNIREFIREKLSEFDIIFTHDLVFTGWNMPYALAIQAEARSVEKPRWLHWIHSVPSSMFDWWQIGAYGPKHKIVFPNQTERTRVAEQFRGSPQDVRIIPHIKDIRTWWGFGADTWKFIDNHPEVLQSDIVCVYPASADRLTAKGVDKIIKIMASIKENRFSVCCVVVNQWATGRQPRENMGGTIDLARSLGLDVGREFIFTSEEGEEYSTGIPQKMLRELMSCSNLFIFPTREESFGLVAPELALSTAAVIVLNKSLNCMSEIHFNRGLYIDFGSFHNNLNIVNEAEYYYQVGKLILGQILQNETVVHRTLIRKYYNMDHLYLKVYQPIFGEMKGWDYRRI